MKHIDWIKYHQKLRKKYSWEKIKNFNKDYWDKFWLKKKESLTSSQNRDFINKLLELLNVNKDDTVLDIGAGNGGLSIPLRERAKSLTAIDISDIALNQIKDRAADKKLNNIYLINKKWENIEAGKDITPHDIVLMSHVYILDHLKESLLKIDLLTKKRACLVEAINPKIWNHPVLWERLFKKSFIARPDYMVMVNILYQLGIHANVKIWEYEMVQYYQSIEEAVVFWQSHYQLSDKKSKNIINDYLNEILIEKENHYVFQKNQKAALIYWEK